MTLTLPLRPALFLDRDGVINRDKGYVFRIEDFEWIDGAVDCIRHFRELGWLVFVVTNQSGIARNYYTLEDMMRLHEWMRGELSRRSADVDDIYYCPYHDAGENEAFRKDSFDRKPNPGMILRAMEDHPVDRRRSFLIGDKASDLQAAEAAGIPGFYFPGGRLDTFAGWALAQLDFAAAESE